LSGTEQGIGEPRGAGSRAAQLSPVSTTNLSWFGDQPRSASRACNQPAHECQPVPSANESQPGPGNSAERAPQRARRFSPQPAQGGASLPDATGLPGSEGRACGPDQHTIVGKPGSPKDSRKSETGAESPWNGREPTECGWRLSQKPAIPQVPLDRVRGEEEGNRARTPDCGGARARPRRIPLSRESDGFHGQENNQSPRVA
jgi:hypothetical protein